MMNKFKKGTFKLSTISIMMVLILGICVFTIAAGQNNSASVKKDKIDYEFVDDTDVLGAWKSVSFVDEIENFKPEDKFDKEDLYLKKMAFAKNGVLLIAYGNDNLVPTFGVITWTKGLVLDKQDYTASKYTIKEIQGKTYMFYEWKSGDYTIRNMKPKYYVLEKIDSKDYSDFKVKNIKEDKIDYPFVMKKEMLGNWESVGFVSNIKDFKPNIKSGCELYLKNILLTEDGKATLTGKNNKNRTITWTKDMIIDKSNKTASKCTIKVIDKNKYMFYEWKSGDYIYRGMKPHYYVLKLVD